MRQTGGATMRIVDVDEISQYIRDVLDSDPLLDDIWIRGETSNCRMSQPGHCYFSLKSASSQLRCVLFRNDYALVSHKPSDGDAVIAHGRVSSYPAFGTYQLYVDQILPEGDGLLQLQFEALRRKLEDEGIFDPSRKRPLPEHPRKIAVVTSPTGSVWHDIQDVLRRRYPLCELILAAAVVQGDNAPSSIINAIQTVIEHGEAEVVIVARGGGSIEDLWGFNDERVVRAVYRSPIPVVSAIGHETDVTLTDLAADLRAPTPSAAAELVAPHLREYRQHLATCASTLGALISRQVAEHRYHLHELQRDLSRFDPRWTLDHERMRLDRLAENLERSTQQLLTTERQRIDSLGRQLALLDPSHLLSRGYALVTHAETGRRVHGVAEMKHGQSVRLAFRDGTATASVDDLTRRTNGDEGSEQSE